MTSTRKPRPTLSSSAGLAVLVALTLTLPLGQAQLLTADSQLWTQETSGIPGESAVGDLFGMSFASGDFDNDGFPDLAIGVPQKTVEVDDGMGGMDTFGTAGEVMVLYGSASRLTAMDVQLFTQATADVPGDPATFARFGFALAAADFNKDGFADLAASAIGAPVSGISAGAVIVLNGSPGGLTATGSQLWTQDTPEVLGASELNDLFGISLAASDFNGDAAPDLAIGIRGENVGSTVDAGAVALLYAAAGGLSADGNQFWSQDSPGIAGAPETSDLFGRSLTSGDFNNDSYDDLAIGVPNEDVGALDSAGAVNVIYGSVGGLTATGDQLWTQNSAGILGGAEAGDLFGFSVRAGDFNNDGFGDLAIGVPLEDIGPVVNAGAVNVIYGAAGAGLVAAGNQIWSGDNGLPNFLETGDDYGRTLAAGDFNNDGFDDLAIGGPLEDVVAIADAGAVSVLYGSGIGGLTAQGGQSFHQNVAGIADAAETSDRFGGGGGNANVETTPLATGDFNGDRFLDLVIGVPNEDFEDPDIGTIANSGAFHVLYGGLDLSDELQQALLDLQNVVNQLGLIPIP